MQLNMPLMIKKRHGFFQIVLIALVVVGLVGMLAQSVFAQTTYRITDGEQVKTIRTYTSDPAQVLTEAGYTLEEDDIYTTQVTTDGISEITVRRAQLITIDHCGQQIQVNSYGETVESLLDRLDIPFTGDYSVSQPLDTETYDGMVCTVTSNVERTELYTRDVPFGTVYYDDPTLPLGERRCLVEGVSGQSLCTAEVTYYNGEETSRVVVKEKVLEKPVTELVAVGTGENVGGDAKPIIKDGFIILPSGEVLTYTHTDQFEATAYTSTCEGCDEITANGSRVKVGVVAIDPTVVKYGTRMFVVANDGSYIYGLSTAEDCGADIKGHRLDLYFETEEECWAFGRRDCTVYFLGGANWQ